MGLTDDGRSDRNREQLKLLSTAQSDYRGLRGDCRPSLIPDILDGYSGGRQDVRQHKRSSVSPW